MSEEIVVQEVKKEDKLSYYGSTDFFTTYKYNKDAIGGSKASFAKLSLDLKS